MMLGLVTLGLGGYLFYKVLLADRSVRDLISLRRGASLATLRRRAGFKGPKGRRARIILEAAESFCASLVRRPHGWVRGRGPYALPGPLEAYTLECGLEGIYYKDSDSVWTAQRSPT